MGLSENEKLVTVINYSRKVKVHWHLDAWCICDSIIRNEKKNFFGTYIIKQDNKIFNSIKDRKEMTPSKAQSSCFNCQVTQK